jgi:hypothetical protein
LTVTGVTAGNKVYDGTTVATLNTTSATLTGVVAGDSVNLVTSGVTGTFTSKNAGVNLAVNITGLTLSGADALNYTLTQPTATANITVAVPTVALGNLIQIYDGTAKSVTATTTPAGLSVSVTYDVGSAVPIEPGRYAVVATLNDINFQGSATGTLFIIPAIRDIIAPSDGDYRAGQTLGFSINYSGPVTVITNEGTPTLKMIIGNVTRDVNYVSGSGSTMLSFSYPVQAGDTAQNGVTVVSPLVLNGGLIQDSFGNDAPLTFVSPNLTGVVVDTTPPTIVVSAPSSPMTANGPVTYTVTYADANFNASTLTAADVTLNTTGTVTGTVFVSGAGLKQTVTISGITGGGTVGISINAGTATDLAGNPAPAAGPSATFTVDRTLPTVIVSGPSTQITSLGPVTYGVTYSDPADPGFTLQSFTPSAVTLNAMGTATGTVSIAGTGNTRVVTISNITGDGTLGISIANGIVSDGAGNLSAGGGPSATFVVDNTAPTVTISGPSASVTGSTPVHYTVVYTDTNFANCTLTTGDVTLHATGTAMGTVSVSGGGTNWTVTIASITGEGTLGISLGVGTAKDLAGNLAPMAGPSVSFAVSNAIAPVSLMLAIGPSVHGAFPIRVTGPPGKIYELQASSNFSNWLALVDLTLTNGSADYLDTPSPDEARRFYRAVAVLPLELSVVGRTNGGATIRVNGTPGRNIELEASTDLRNWLTVGGLLLTNGTSNYLDASANQLTQRFYRATYPPPFRLLATTRLANGQYQLVVEGPAGDRIDIEASTNLVNWTSVGLVTLTGTNLVFVDTLAWNNRTRFYRIAALP